MRKLAFVLINILIVSSIFAQAPETISYQAVIRNSGGELVANTVIGLQISILYGSINGTAVYIERQKPTTNANGLVGIELGTGVSFRGLFSSINWSNGPYYVKTEVDPGGNSNYSITTTSQMLSVPYSLYANVAGSLLGGVTESDPVYSSSAASGITNSDIESWNNKSEETDPVYSSERQYLKIGVDSWIGSLAKTIDQADTARWGRDETDPFYSLDSSMIKTGIAYNRLAIIDTASQIRADMLKGDSVYLADSSMIRTSIALNRQAIIDTAAQIRTDMLNGDLVYLVDSTFLKLGVRSWNNSIAKSITAIDTALWNSKSNFDGNYSSLTNAPDIAVSTTDKNITLASGQTFSVKDASNTYLRVNQSSGLVGIGNVTSPRASLEIGGYDGLLCTGTTSSGTARALGAGVRFQWYPRKGALRAGKAEGGWWDDDGSSSPKLALYSCAIGYQPRASGVASNAIGAYNKATGDYALALGSYCQASASHSIAIGTQVFASGIYSIALGTGADTNGHDGAMVIGDDTYFQTAYASADNQLTMRFSGGYRLWSSYPDSAAGVYMRHRQSGWSNYCDRNKKENFQTLDYEDVLKKIDKTVPVTEWNYKKTDTATRYIGPMAQDFYAAFQLGGTDSLGINSINEMGVNLAAIHGLIDRTNSLKQNVDSLNSVNNNLELENKELKQQLETLQTSNKNMMQRLDALEALVESIKDEKQKK